MHVGICPDHHGCTGITSYISSGHAIVVEIGIAVNSIRKRTPKIFLRGIPYVIAVLLLCVRPEPLVQIVEIRRRVAVPRAARRFVALVLGFQDRHELPDLLHGFERLCPMPVDHSADPLSLGDLFRRGNGAAAHEASAVRVEQSFQRGHLAHVFRRDFVVSCLPEEHGRRVPEVDDGIAHGLHTLIPGAANDVLFFVSCGADGHDAVLVAGSDGGGLRDHVHPADEICT